MFEVDGHYLAEIITVELLEVLPVSCLYQIVDFRNERDPHVLPNLPSPNCHRANIIIPEGFLLNHVGHGKNVQFGRVRDQCPNKGNYRYLDCLQPEIE